MTYDMIFTALADPRRRNILQQIATQPMSVAQLADQHNVSRPAISQHLKILTDAGLLSVTPKGTKRIYQINRDGLAPVRAYIDGFWDDALTAFQDHIINQAKD
ncbi:transcriptional regulator [Amylibacter ulvae]|uniref:Transcriptional regulator n=1 Tax=Paramylibacter ulvae TaxID=1651968 RepID=A0ABQ3CTG0_9RHOB|nr:metalloregulator ArsR/SmtB family transcription factor [Amylibacter ulvae]GHA41164.1 transcriptional regulator [Amylibacter ulvae]